MEQELFPSEVDRLYGDDYRNENSGALSPDHVLPSNTAVGTSGELSTPKAQDASGDPEATKELAEQVVQKTPDEDKVFGYSVLDFVNTMYPNGPNVRHTAALKLYFDLLVLFDGNYERSRRVLLLIPWVQDVIKERGMAEIERIIEAGRKRFLKRESESLSDPQPSKEMRRAIEQVAGRKYSVMVRELRAKALGQAVATQDDILHVLERIGRELKKLMPYYPLLQLLFFRLKLKFYAAAFFLGGAFAMNLLTRCWYSFWPAPGERCRLNHLLLLIGRMGGGKRLAVMLYKIMMQPIKVSDAAQIAALNNWNKIKEQNDGGAKNKTPRPAGIYRALPSETSTAALREAEANAHETIDGEEWYLHVSCFDSELQNTLSQLKKSYMDALQTYWLKSFHNEPHGAYLKTSSAPVGETDIHFSAVYTGTDDAMKKLNTESNFVNGLDSRFTVVPNADSNFEMMEVYDYDDAARQRDADLLEWAYKLDACKGEIPCKLLSDALKDWTARRMADAGEDNDLAQEDLVKRPCWHAINFALPFVLCRHFDKMVEDNGKWVCGPDFAVDKTDVKLALLIANAQLAFQEYYFKAIGEKHYDDLATERASNVRHQQKTLLAFRRLPDPFTSDDVDREYGYHGSTGSICSRLKRLCDDGMAQKIRQGEDKGKYRKLM
ncbi:MAG: hypothetical protein IJQ76_04380 [Prevotella sp.]|nr:hypothetical protein [Prevotella sp.]